MRASRSDLLIVSSWVVLMIEQPLNPKVFPSPAATEFMGRGVDGSPISPEKFPLASESKAIVTKGLTLRNRLWVKSLTVFSCMLQMSESILKAARSNDPDLVKKKNNPDLTHILFLLRWCKTGLFSGSVSSNESEIEESRIIKELHLRSVKELKIDS
ncbi:hypothetical protein F2Q68_00022469 [Brassica cretica]|uniref:Uncharacterized protein n=1 Tax=Brassica cretica TaxID=69181 RepID=A0A8S9FTT1_BRACR|nr:hypothetical protein F2Q68_00022469 [Brassica cretica]